MKTLITCRSLAALLTILSVHLYGLSGECIAGNAGSGECIGVARSFALILSSSVGPGCFSSDFLKNDRGIINQSGPACEYGLVEADTFPGNRSSAQESLSTSLIKEGDKTRRKVRLWSPEELKRVLEAQSEPMDDGSGRLKEQKNARLAMLCSLLFPGLGQLYAGKPYKAALAMGIETFYLGQILLNYRYAKREERLRDRYPRDSYEYYRHDIWVDEYKARTVDWMWWTGGAIFLIVVDAYVDAHLYDMEVNLRADAAAGRIECTLGLNF